MKQLYLFLFFTCLLFNNLINAQTIRYDWTNSYGSLGVDDSKDIAVASDNSIYVVGQFTNTVDFDPSALVTSFTTIIPAGYIAHYTPNGALINALPLLSTSAVSCIGVEVDDSNNVYVSGYFGGAVDFDPSSGLFILTASGVNDMFIAKYNSAHQLVWAKQYGGSLNVYNTDLEYANGRLSANGRFNGSVIFNPGNSITASGGYDVFVLNINRNGTFQWVKTFGNSGNEDSRSVCQDYDGNVYVAGSYTGVLDVDPSNVTNNITSNGSNGGDAFIIKLDSMGNYVWSRVLNGGGAEFVFDMQTQTEDLYIYGSFSWTVDFDPGSSYDTLSNLGGLDAFAWKLDLNGNHSWVRSVGNSSFDFYDGRSIAFSKAGEPYFLGIFEGTANFNKQGSDFLSSNGAFDIYVWALSASGSFKWVKGFGGSAEDIGTAIATDNQDNIILGGFFRTSVDFNPWSGVDTKTALSASTINHPDFFVSKWKNCESYKLIAHKTCDKVYNWNNQNFNTSGIYTGVFQSVDSCDSTVYLNLSFVAIDTTLTVIQQTIFSNHNGSFNQWYDCATWQPINGATQQSFTSNTPGQFAVIIQEDICTDTSECVTLGSLSTEAHNTKKDVQFFPNPAKDNLFINTNLKIDVVAIYGIDGKLITQSLNPKESVDVSNLIDGAYLIEFVLENGNRRRYQLKKMNAY
jgi:hypothetical protein